MMQTFDPVGVSAHVDPRGDGPSVPFRYWVARAADGPAATLVVDMRRGYEQRTGIGDVEVLASCRAFAMACDQRLGAKTIGILACTEAAMDLLFLQGNGVEVDPLSEVCVNSSVAAVAVAKDCWHLVPSEIVTVHMGSVSFEIADMAS